MNRLLGLSVIMGPFVVAVPIAGEARGELITFAFSGTVTTARVIPCPPLQGYDFPDVGDPFTGIYTFDSNATDTAN